MIPNGILFKKGMVMEYVGKRCNNFISFKKKI